MTVVSDLDAVAMRLPATLPVEGNTIAQAARRLTKLADQIRDMAEGGRPGQYEQWHDIADQIAGP